MNTLTTRRNRQLLRALVLGLFLFAAGASAQSNTSGNLLGEAKAGDIIVIRGDRTGFERKLQIEQDGKYRLRALPTGIYIVTVTHADGSSEEPKAVKVNVGTTTRVK
jgi:hypothetical protein